MGDEYLLEAFRHNAWANQRLIAFCQELSAEQLDAKAAGTYGTILETLNHVVASDAGYLPRIKVQRPEWAGDDADVKGLDVLAARVDEVAKLWEAYLPSRLDARHKLSLDGGAYEAQASVPVVQALHHANVHREQVCAILTSLGVEPPDLQVWVYAEEKGLAREVSTSGS